MRKIIFNLIALFVLSLMLSCGGEQASNKETDPKAKNEVAVEQAVDGNLIGIWVTDKQGGWVEFLADGTFAMGKEDKEPVEGKKFEFDSKSMTLTLHRKKGPVKKQVRFAMEDGVEVLFVKAEGKDKEIRYTKVNKRPVQK